MKYTYSTVKNKRGTWRIRHWLQKFKDDSTGKFVIVKRSEPIKLNGEPIRFYSDSEIKRMTPSQRKAILL